MRLTIVTQFTYAGGNGDEFYSEWIRIPEEFQNWQMMVLVHSHISTTAALLQAETSWDTGVPDPTGVPVSLATNGPNPVNIPIGMGPLFRIHITSTADSAVTISVFLTQKVS